MSRQGPSRLHKPGFANVHLIDGEQYQRMGANGAGGHVTAEQAFRIAEALQQRAVSLPAGSRLLADGSVTADAPVERFEYSVTAELLGAVAEFSRRSGGFAVL